MRSTQQFGKLEKIGGLVKSVITSGTIAYPSSYYPFSFFPLFLSLGVLGILVNLYKLATIYGKGQLCHFSKGIKQCCHLSYIPTTTSADEYDATNGDCEWVKYLEIASLSFLFTRML